MCVREYRLLLGLYPNPQHVLPLGHVRVLFDEVTVAWQQELPATVYTRHRHVFQEVLHILRQELKIIGVNGHLVTPSRANC